jgi:hypothetical protein
MYSGGKFSVTGFPAIDSVMNGLYPGSLGLLIGHTGGGKTAMAVYSAIQNALLGRKVWYLSLEEPVDDIWSRIYSNLFRVSYTDIKFGRNNASARLEKAFESKSDAAETVLRNLTVHDFSKLKPTCDYLKRYLEYNYSLQLSRPDVIYIDQMDYLETVETFDNKWEKYDQLSKDVWRLAVNSAGSHKFSVWLLHQAKGKMRRTYANDDISAFNGVMRPADLVLAIGRDSNLHQVASIFTLKSRHSPNLKFDYLTHFEFMDFEYYDHGAVERTNISKV